MSSNPTNLVLVGAFSVPFTTFTAFMALPFLAAAIVTYPVFLVMFRGQDYIPRSIDVQGEHSAIEPSSMLVDKRGAIFGSVLLTATLGVLVGTSILDVPVWQITVPPAVIMLIRDVVHDWYKSRPAPQPESIEVEAITVASQTDTTMGVPPPTTFSGRARILEASHPKLSHFKIPNHGDRAEAASRRACAVCAFDIRSGSGIDEEGLG